jgi:DNA polymerase-3 subunit epsilon
VDNYSYYFRETGLSRGQDDATAKKKVCTWMREYFRLDSEFGTLISVNEMEDGLMWFSVGANLPVPARAVPSTADVYDAAYKRYQVKAKAKKTAEDKEKAFRKQLASGDIYGLHPERAQRQALEEALAEAGFVQVYPEPAGSEATRVLVPTPPLVDDVTVLDIEFQGTDLLEFAAIRYQHGEPVGEYATLVHFTGQVQSYITQLTGITTLHVADPKLPREKEVLQQFKKLAGDSLLVCHNIGADKRILEAARTRQGAKEELTNPWLCTLALARRRVKTGLLPSNQKCGLGELCLHFKIENRGAHRAKRDVQMCAALLRHFHEQQPVTKADLYGAPQPGKKNKNIIPAGPGLFAAA